MRKLIFAMLFWATAAAGQGSLPAYKATTVNDFAALMNEAEHARLVDLLEQLRRDTGVEMTVVTLQRQADFAPETSLERFATRLFDHWGIGDADRNDGVLILVLHQDRAMRIELGATFGRNWDQAAQAVIDSHFLPAFADGRYGAGIMDGSRAVIDDIVMPYLDGAEAPAPESEGMSTSVIVVLFAILAVLVPGRHILSDGLARFRRCPLCGKRGLRQRRHVVHRATTTANGSGVRRINCTDCDYATSTTYIVARKSRSSSGGFGGGRSGGGGASGRW